MHEDSTIPGQGRDGSISPLFQSDFRLVLCLRSADKTEPIPPSLSKDAVQHCLYYLDTITTLLAMLSEYRLNLFGSTSTIAMLITIGELCDSLTAEAFYHLDKLGEDYERLERELDAVKGGRQ